MNRAIWTAAAALPKRASHLYAAATGSILLQPTAASKASCCTLATTKWMGCVGHAAVVAAAPARSQSQLATGLRFQWSSHSSHYSNGLQSHYLHTSAAHAEFINSRGGKNHGGKGSSGGRRDNADKRRGAKEFDSDSVGDGGAEEGGSQQKRDPPPVFEFSFDPADQQVFLKTGTVSAENIATVRAEIKAHSDFSDELKLVDKTTHSVELYFLRVVAVNLARNPHMTVEEKREMIAGIREMITDPELMIDEDEE